MSRSPRCVLGQIGMCADVSWTGVDGPVLPWVALLQGAGRRLRPLLSIGFMPAAEVRCPSPARCLTADRAVSSGDRASTGRARPANRVRGSLHLESTWKRIAALPRRRSASWHTLVGCGLRTPPAGSSRRCRREPSRCGERWRRSPRDGAPGVCDTERRDRTPRPRTIVRRHQRVTRSSSPERAVLRENAFDRSRAVAYWGLRRIQTLTRAGMYRPGELAEVVMYRLGANHVGCDVSPK